jgi:hypothetical protein
MTHMSMYDTQAEVTVTGTVQEVRTLGGMMPGDGPVALHGMGRGMGMQGTHLILQTETGTLEVHLGPTAFLESEKIIGSGSSDQPGPIAQGDTIEVVGSRMTIGGSRALIAREIRKGGQSWTLRDANGRPRWSVGMGRR